MIKESTFNSFSGQTLKGSQIKARGNAPGRWRNPKTHRPKIDEWHNDYPMVTPVNPINALMSPSLVPGHHPSVEPGALIGEIAPGFVKRFYRSGELPRASVTPSGSFLAITEVYFIVKVKSGIRGSRGYVCVDCMMDIYPLLIYPHNQVRLPTDQHSL